MKPEGAPSPSPKKITKTGTSSGKVGGTPPGIERKASKAKEKRRKEKKEKKKKQICSRRWRVKVRHAMGESVLPKKRQSSK